MGLCYRCEHRADFKETGRRPRYECGTDYAVVSCYMYQPVMPVILKKEKGDRRPQFGPAMISARSQAVGVSKFELDLHKTRNGVVLYWRPKSDKKRRQPDSETDLQTPCGM